MAVARGNPIPPGVYWLDVFRPFGSSTVEDQDLHFILWKGQSGAAVRVLNREVKEVLPSDSEENRDRVRVWYLFEVVGKPAPFPFHKLGFPTVKKLAKDGITPGDRAATSYDTVQKPEPATAFEELKTAINTGFSPSALLLGLLALYLYASTKKG